MRVSLNILRGTRPSLVWGAYLRFYNLLVGLDDGVTWRLYTYKDGYLSISPKPWSPTDLPEAWETVAFLSVRLHEESPEVKRVPGNHHSHQAYQRLAILEQGVP